MIRYPAQDFQMVNHYLEALGNPLESRYLTLIFLLPLCCLQTINLNFSERMYGMKINSSGS